MQAMLKDFVAFYSDKESIRQYDSDRLCSRTVSAVVISLASLSRALGINLLIMMAEYVAYYADKDNMTKYNAMSHTFHKRLVVVYSLAETGRLQSRVPSFRGKRKKAKGFMVWRLSRLRMHLARRPYF